MKRVLVLDASQRSALATTRSLGRRGVPVITADDSPTALAGASRFSVGYHSYASPQTQPVQFIADIAALVRQEHVEIILPMTELTMGLLLEARDHFVNVCLPFADAATIDALANKCALMRLAESLDVPVPTTWYVDNPATLPGDLSALPYPVVVKPGRSWQQVDGHWIRAAVRFANSPDAVQDLVNTEPGLRTQPFMLQACVAGSGQGVFALYDQGKPIAFFSHRRLREKPPSGGVSVLSESVPVDPELLAIARTLLDAVSWHGVAMVEFKVGADGTAYLMEVNTRLWGSLQLAVDAGVDFPWLLYQMACGESLSPSEGYRTGRRSRWLLGDLDNLYLNLRNNELGNGEKLRCLLHFMTPRPFRTRHEVDRWSDMRPFWWELRQYVRDLLNRK